MPQVAEYRLHRGKTPAVLNASLGAVYARFHFVGVAHAVFLAPEERHLSHLGFLRGEQATIPMHARHAVALCTLELHRRIAVDRAAAAVAVELFSGRADTRSGLRVVVEVFRLVASCLLWLAANGRICESMLNALLCVFICGSYPE